MKEAEVEAAAKLSECTPSVQVQSIRKPDDKSTFIGGGVTDFQSPDRIHEFLLD